MQKFGKIIKQINRRTNMEHETFECSFKKALEKDVHKKKQGSETN